VAKPREALEPHSYLVSRALFHLIIMYFPLVRVLKSRRELCHENQLGYFGGMAKGMPQTSREWGVRTSAVPRPKRRTGILIADIQSEGTAFTGKTVGMIESIEALRNDATNLSLKLTPQDRKLVGRILATAKNPGTLLPYVLTLNREAT
jgi:hypothetical protein